MDRVHLGRARHAQDVVDVEVRRQRLLALADQVAFVGLETVQRQPIFT